MTELGEAVEVETCVGVLCRLPDKGGGRHSNDPESHQPPHPVATGELQRLHGPLHQQEPPGSQVTVFSVVDFLEMIVLTASFPPLTPPS